MAHRETKGSKKSEKWHPWCQVSRTFPKYPRICAVLQKMWVRLDDKSLTDYSVAVILSDSFSETRLKQAGINFDTMTGAEMIQKFEDAMRRSRSGHQTDLATYKKQIKTKALPGRVRR